MMKLISTLVFAVMLFGSSAAFSQEGQITDYYFDPGDTLHPIKLGSLAIRPPIGLLSLFVKGTYWVFDSYPIREGFNIEYQPRISVDGDY